MRTLLLELHPIALSEQEPGVLLLRLSRTGQVGPGEGL